LGGWWGWGGVGVEGGGVGRRDEMRRERNRDMIVSTENATPPKSSRSRNSDSSVQIQTEPTCQFEFVPRYTEKSGFLDLIDVGDVAFSVETVIESAQGKELARGDTAPAGAREKSQEK